MPLDNNNSRDVCRSNPAGGSVSGVEAILDIDSSFSDHIVRADHVVVENSDRQHIFHRYDCLEVEHSEKGELFMLCEICCRNILCCRKIL